MAKKKPRKTPLSKKFIPQASLVSLEVDKDDVLEVQVKSADGTDAVLRDSIFYINYLHE